MMRRLLCIGLVWMLWGAVSLRAQNNPFKIDDTSYAMYMRASKNRRTELGLSIADSLLQRGIRLKDGKVQCLALTIPLVHHFVFPNRFEEVHEAVEALKKKAREVKLLQYYYYAISNEVNYYSNHNRTLYALTLSEEMRKEAFAENHPYGIFVSIRSLGNINLTRRNEQLALQHFLEAYNYGVVNCKDQDMAGVINRIVVCYSRLGNFEEALKYARLSEKEAKTVQSRLSVKSQVGALYYNTGLYDDFLRVYDECQALVAEYGDMGVVSLSGINVFKLILDKRYEEAYRLCDSMSVEEDRYIFGRKVAVKAGDFKRASAYVDKLLVLRDSMNRVIQQSDFAEMNARMGNELLRMEAKDLQLKNANLNLQNANLDLEKANAKIEFDRMEREKHDLQMQNNELELTNLKATSERQQLLMREQRLQSEHDASVARNLFLLISLVVVSLAIFSYSRYRSNLVLRRKNKELGEAREKAEEADRAKTVFLQNMSHEIRTPLNAIVGFSEILCEDEVYGISSEEKADLKVRILRNSELLTTLINDILDLSCLENGKYAMDIVPTSCNDICQNAIKTVQHRQPRNVKLYYTTEVADDFTLPTDGKRLQQVLINFLTNAEKNTSEGEIHLHCSVMENPGMVTFSVADTGTGIPLEKQQFIFERFSKLDSFKQGTGLGLNICTIIAERLGGRVYLDTRYTDGARFVLALPQDGPKK